MSETINILIYSAAGAMPVVMALGIVISAFMPTLERWNKRYFIALFTLFCMCSICCFFALLFWGNPKMAAAEMVIYFFESVFLSSPVIMPNVFLLHTCKDGVRRKRLIIAAAVLLGVYFLIVMIAQFTDVFYYVTADNRYFRGEWYALALLPLEAIMVLNVVLAIRWRKQLTRRYYIALLIYLLPMTVVLFVNMFLETEVLVVLCMALFALLMFVLILTDNMEQYMKQQREIANQRAGLMVLQMRPHFICNTMMGIYYLCDQDPQKAKQVTLDFTTYLRKNFTALTSEQTIPFTEELEHTRAYLAVEQAQFEDTLFVDFDTPHTLFRVPPLTLQPIVENAVKHGMRASNEPIHICVVTRKTDAASEIIVEDDGPGFAPADDNEPHIGLNNIRQRLELMCGGTLTISPREGGGTSAKVTIPTINS